MTWSSARRRWRCSGSAARPSRRRPARLHEIQQLALRIDQGGESLATIAAAAVDGQREGAGARSLMAVIIASHHAQKLAVGVIELREAGTAPPQAVALRRQWALGIQSGMDEEQAL